MNDLRPSGSGITHNPYALNSFAPSHRRVESTQTLIPAPSIASYTPPPVAILNSLSPVWEPKPPVPKKNRRQSGSGWELSNGSLPPSPKSPTHDDTILGSLKRAVSPFRQPESLEARPSVYRSLSISTPTSLRSRSNSSSSSVPPITPNEAVPIPPPKPYHYTKRHSTYALVPEKTTVSYPRPPDVTKDMSMTTKRQPELIRVKENKDTTPSRATSHSDPDLSQAQRQRQRQRDDASSGAAANAHPIIRELEPQSHIRPKDHAPVKEHTKVSGDAEISTQSPPMIVPSRRKESLPQAIFTSSKDDLNLPQQTSSTSQKSDSIFAKTWGRQKDPVGNKRNSRRASSIFLPHLVPNPNFTTDPDGRITEEEEEPPGTPGIRRRDERNGWSGEWNQDTIQEVIDKLRALR